MDGVLIDSEGFWKQAEEEVFSSLGVEVTEEYTNLTRSMTTSEVTEFWFNKYPWKEKALEDVEEMVISRVIELIKTQSCQNQGVKPFIEKLKEYNYKIGLATNSPYKIIPVVLEKLEIQHLFDSVLSAEFEIKGKPDPAIYHKAAAILDTDPSNCIVIEDSHTGMMAAKNAGMKVIAFTNGNLEINFELADCRINCFEENGFEMITSQI